MKQPKTISFTPSPELETRIEQLTKQLRTSKAGLSELALEFVTERILSGRAKCVNGQIELQSELTEQAA